jgi:protein gp37
MQRTSIEWTDFSVNMIRSRRVDTGRLGHWCIKLSPGCANCYSGVWNGWRGNGLPFTAAAAEQAGMFLDRDVLQKLLRRRKPARIFVEDMSDLFGDWVPDEWLDAIYAAMAMCRHMTFQVLTKRAERMARYVATLHRRYDDEGAWGAGRVVDALGGLCRSRHDTIHDRIADFGEAARAGFPNIWHGVSVEDRRHGLPRVEHLRATPAAIRFLSVEPLLEDLGEIDLTGIDWAIVGGESGTAARPCELDWIRAIVRQCKAAGVAAFVKQLGANVEARNDRVADWFGECGHLDLTPTERFQGAVGCVRGLRDRKGGDPDEWPEDLRVRQMPRVREGARA